MRPTRVDLPEPVWPTIATVRPAGMWKLTWSSARPEGYATVTSSKRISPAIAAGERGSAGTARDGRSRKISSMRERDAVPRWIRFTTQPSAIMGQTSMPM